MTLTSHFKLMLSAGQLQFPSPRSRTVGLALAALCTPMDDEGKRGRALVTYPLIRETAEEYGDTKGLDNSGLKDIFGWLERLGYIVTEQPGLDGWPVMIDTTRLPTRDTQSERVTRWPFSTNPAQEALERLARRDDTDGPGDDH